MADRIGSTCNGSKHSYGHTPLQRGCTLSVVTSDGLNVAGWWCKLRHGIVCMLCFTMASCKNTAWRTVMFNRLALHEYVSL